MTTESTPIPTRLRTAPIMLLASGLLALSLSVAGCYYYRQLVRTYRDGAERQLMAIADLKISELRQWRAERLGDGEVLSNNPLFSDLVRTLMDHPEDAETRRRLQDWMGKVQSSYNYEEVSLLDAQGQPRLSVPAAARPLSSTVAQRLPEVLRSGQVAFQDFYRDEQDQRVYLAVLVPLFDDTHAHRPLGVLKLRIDPQCERRNGICIKVAVENGMSGQPLFFRIFPFKISSSVFFPRLIQVGPVA